MRRIEPGRVSTAARMAGSTSPRLQASVSFAGRPVAVSSMVTTCQPSSACDLGVLTWEVLVRAEPAVTRARHDPRPGARVTSSDGSDDGAPTGHGGLYRGDERSVELSTTAKLAPVWPIDHVIETSRASTRAGRWIATA